MDQDKNKKKAVALKAGLQQFIADKQKSISFQLDKKIEESRKPGISKSEKKNKDALIESLRAQNVLYNQLGALVYKVIIFNKQIELEKKLTESIDEVSQFMDANSYKNFSNEFNVGLGKIVSNQATENITTYKQITQNMKKLGLKNSTFISKIEDYLDGRKQTEFQKCIKFSDTLASVNNPAKKSISSVKSKSEEVKMSSADNLVIKTLQEISLDSDFVEKNPALKGIVKNIEQFNTAYAEKNYYEKFNEKIELCQLEMKKEQRFDLKKANKILMKTQKANSKLIEKNDKILEKLNDSKIKKIYAEFCEMKRIEADKKSGITIYADLVYEMEKLNRQMNISKDLVEEIQTKMRETSNEYRLTKNDLDEAIALGLDKFRKENEREKLNIKIAREQLEEKYQNEINENKIIRANAISEVENNGFEESYHWENGDIRRDEHSYFDDAVDRKIDDNNKSDRDEVALNRIKIDYVKACAVSKDKDGMNFKEFVEREKAKANTEYPQLDEEGYNRK